MPERLAFPALVLLLLWPASSAAWTTCRTSGGLRVRWPEAAVAQGLAYSMDETGLAGDGLEGVALESAVRTSFLTWEEVGCGSCSAGACTGDPCRNHALGVSFDYEGRKPPQRLGLDCAELDAGGDKCLKMVPNGNQVTFIKDPLLWPWGSTVFAATLLSYDKKSGRLADADIAFNDAAYSFCLKGCGPGQPMVANALTHEIGHFLGLDHSEVGSATMHELATPEDTHMASLDPDDIAGICALYPEAGRPKSCAQATEGGCQAGPGGQAAAVLALLALALGAAATGRGLRRRAQSASPPFASGRAPGRTP